MKYPVYNQNGKETEETVTLPKEIFEVQMNRDLVHQVVVSQQSNRRQVSAHTKMRGEVRGGGRKPWRQKGTGRARHGSIRSPLWVGGGVSGGPRNDKNYTKIVPLKIRRKALFMVLSEKAKNNNLVVLDKLEPFGLAQGGKPKTKEMAKIIKNLPCNSASRLIATSSEKNVYLSARNIAKTGVEEARNLNVLDLLNFKYLVLTKDGIKTIKETFIK